MSDTSVDLREQIVRIDRMIAETEKFQQETRKYVADARKLDRDRWFVPVSAAVAAVAAVGSFVTLLVRGFH